MNNPLLNGWTFALLFSFELWVQYLNFVPKTFLASSIIYLRRSDQGVKYQSSYIEIKVYNLLKYNFVGFNQLLLVVVHLPSPALDFCCPPKTFGLHTSCEPHNKLACPQSYAPTKESK